MSSLYGTVVRTSVSLSVSVKTHWYTPASDKANFVKSSELSKPVEVATNSPFLIHDTTGTEEDVPVCVTLQRNRSPLTEESIVIPVLLSESDSIILSNETSLSAGCLTMESTPSPDELKARKMFYTHIVIPT